MKQLFFILMLAFLLPAPCRAEEDIEKAIEDVMAKNKLIPAIYAAVIGDIPTGDFATRWPAIEKRMADLSPDDLAKAKKTAAEKIMADKTMLDAVLAMNAMLKLDKPKAEALARKALAADPDNAVAHAVLAEVLWRKCRAMDSSDATKDWAGYNLKEKKLMREAHAHALRVMDERLEGLPLAANTSMDEYHAMPFFERSCRFKNKSACKRIEKIQSSFLRECERNMQVAPCSDVAWNACSKEAGDKEYSYKIPNVMLALARIHGGLCPGKEDPDLVVKLLDEASEKADSELYCQIRVQRAKADFREGKYESAVRELIDADKCGQRDPESFYYLALAYLEGKGVDKDETLGMQYLERAAAHDVPAASFLLASRLLAGEEKNFNKGVVLMHRAATMGKPEAKRFFSRIWRKK